ncbi:MAG: accessory factor UbiK family protein [Pseudomonadota bacterium]
MQTTGKFFDDMAKLMTNAAGVAQGVRGEAEAAFRSWMERWIADANLVTREEFDAVREMAVRAREENERLEARLAALEAKLGATD